MRRSCYPWVWWMLWAGLVTSGPVRMLSANVLDKAVPIHRLPKIDPDYCGVVFPPNIAPPNFVVQESGSRYAIEFRSAEGKSLQVTSANPQICIPVKSWHELLRVGQGKEIYCEIFVQRDKGEWSRFDTITNQIALEKIDRYLVYRLLNWQFTIYSSGTMGIYQRNLENQDESVLLHVKERERGKSTCMNCHSFLLNQPNPMALHIRMEWQSTKPMLIARDGQVAHVAKPAGLLAWHPSGQLLAFSMNRFMTLFHTIGRNQDVYDGTGDLGVYFVNEATVSGTPKIAETNWFETWPAWPPDGQYLYFCRAPNLPVERFREIRYDLMRIRYDLKTDTWGEVESLLTAQAAGLSIAQPRISPDGKHLMFCMFPYSSFPGTQPASDLYLMDLENRSYRRLDEVNSERSESWHCWSSNGRWFVFSSKRRDGFLTRPYFSYFDSSGKAHKPFLLPQKDPTAYDSTPLMYNLPELVKGPVQVSRRQLFQAVFAPNKIIKPVIDSRLPQSQPQQSDAPRGENTYEQAPPK